MQKQDFTVDGVVIGSWEVESSGACRLRDIHKRIVFSIGVNGRHNYARYPDMSKPMKTALCNIPTNQDEAKRLACFLNFDSEENEFCS